MVSPTQLCWRYHSLPRRQLYVYMFQIQVLYWLFWRFNPNQTGQQARGLALRGARPYLVHTSARCQTWTPGVLTPPAARAVAHCGSECEGCAYKQLTPQDMIIVRQRAQLYISTESRQFWETRHASAYFDWSTDPALAVPSFNKATKLTIHNVLEPCGTKFWNHLGPFKYQDSIFENQCLK